MNKFSKITGLISFWTKVAEFLGMIIIIIFQKSFRKLFNASNLNVTVFPYGEVFVSFALLLIVGFFCFKKDSYNKNRAIICLYFYLFVTILFSNPLVLTTSALLGSIKGDQYLAAKSILTATMNSVLYIFILTSRVCFYLSAGSLIVSKDNENNENVISVSEKSRTKLTLYSAFLGIFGIDRFYAKRIKTGIVKLLLCLPMVVTIICRLLSAVSTSFSDELSYYIFKLTSFFQNQTQSILFSILIAIILYLPMIIFSVVDFVLCASGKMRDSENKPILHW